jgi:hypothetical protein
MTITMHVSEHTDHMNMYSNNNFIFPDHRRVDMTWAELLDMKHKAKGSDMNLQFDAICKQVDQGEHEVIEQTTFVWLVKAHDRTCIDVEHGPLIVYLAQRNILQDGKDVTIHDEIHVSGWHFH